MSEEKKIKVVLLEPGKLARAAEIDASLAGMQKMVGGLIEPFYPFEEQVCIVCNEESKINGMRPNRSVKNDDGVISSSAPPLSATAEEKIWTVFQTSRSTATARCSVTLNTLRG